MTDTFPFPFEVTFILNWSATNVVAGHQPDQNIVTRSFRTSNELRSFIEDATESFNESIATYDMVGFTMVEKVGGRVTYVENVHFIPSNNFQSSRQYSRFSY